ncbi:MAG TPA: hypothetical protein VGE27_16070 [Gemmatimonas sp.]|uniref:hypothetical protein n=1 Tax=Gemmatimonas sp. TaxID=1962908 RepID=UPI002EDAA46E
MNSFFARSLRGTRDRALRGATLWPSLLSVALLQGALQVLPARSLPAQTSAAWRNASADSLVGRAIARRGLQLADSTLLSYQADAHGFLAFLAQLGEGMIIPPKVVQSEELALTIAWWQPGRSAQRLVGRRDTTLLPANVGYYRDRYGVVLDNLPDRIRLGDGQDVRDVPHPLGANAQSQYEYAIGDPLRITIPGREILVDEVKFRPRDASTPAAIGSVYLDRETAAVVRLSMTFTRAAIIDKRIETLVVTLENGLIRERFWLPRKQEVEVSRGSTWFDIPARGIVRGRWEISNYTVNEQIPAPTMALPRWSSVSRDSLRAHPFEARVIDALPPEIQIASSEDVVRARVEAEAAVRAAMLARPATASVTGRGVSDLARFNRAEGLAVGLGGTHRTGTGVQLGARARYGFSDRQLKGHFSIGKAPAFGRTPTLQLFVERDYRELAFAERAGVTNSLASLLFGSDYTQPVDTRAAGILWRRAPNSAFTWRLAAEQDRPTAVTGDPLSRRFAPTLRAWRINGARAEVQGTGGWVPSEPGAMRGLWMLSASAGMYEGRVNNLDGIVVPPESLILLAPSSRRVTPIVTRAQGLLQLTRRLGGDRALFLQTFGGVAGGRDLPPQWLVFAGGPWTAPGYDAQQFGARALLSQRAELRLPVPAPGIPLGRFGKSPSHVTLAPFVQALATASGTAERRTISGVYPSAGVGMLFFYDLLRADVARGLRDGHWRFSIDIDRSFWGIL